MTKEEAIEFLQERIEFINSNYPEIQDYKEALEIAIKALERERAKNEP